MLMLELSGLMMTRAAVRLHFKATADRNGLGGKGGAVDALAIQISFAGHRVKIEIDTSAVATASVSPAARLKYIALAPSLYKYAAPRARFGSCSRPRREQRADWGLRRR